MKINNYVWENDLSLNDLVLKQKEKIDELEDQLQQKENIIKEVREYIKEHPCNTWYYARDGKRELVLCQNELLEILEKGE